MTVYKKLAEARVKLQETDIKKSGFNKFSKFKYYELADFLPSLNKINMDLGILPIFKMNNEKATLVIINFEKPEEVIQFEIPFVSSEVKGANSIQNLGGTETYLRRYLFLAAYEITDGEVFDSLKDEDKVKEEVEIPGIKPNQLKQINILIGEIGVDTSVEEDKAKLYKWLKIDSLKTINCKRATEIIDLLKETKKQREEK